MMNKQITRDDVLQSVRDRLERQRILEKEGFGGLIIRQAKKIDAAINSAASPPITINKTTIKV